MKKKDLDTLKELLLEEKKRKLRHLEELSDSSVQELGQESGDPADIASMEISQAGLQKIGKREKYLLKKIDYALAKIAEGTFGLCENCGEEISVPRLMARPVAQLCIDCKTEEENSERKYSDEGELEEQETELDVEEEP
jgi:DnaK suppressor protein